MKLVRTTASLLLCCAALAVGLPHAASAQPAPGAATAQPTPQQKAQAKKKFIVGKQAFSQGRFEEALAAFRESYSIVASPNSHLMVVHALSELGRNVEAYQEAQAVAQEAEKAAEKQPKYGPTAKAAREEAEKLEGRIGMVTVDVQGVDPAVLGQASLTVANTPIDADRWGAPIPVAPGSIEVVLSTPDGPATRTVDVVAGQQASVTIEPPQPEATGPTGPGEGTDEGPEEDSGPVDLKIPAYIAGGVGVAGFIAFGIFGGLTLSEYGNLEDQCPNNTCTAGQSADADSGKTYQTVANISLVVGIVGVATGATLFIVDMVGGDSEEPAEEDTTPTVAIGPGSVAISGTF